MKLKLTNDEVRLLIDVLKGEEMRLDDIRKPYDRGDWFQQRVDAVAELKDRLKAVRV